MIKLPAVALVGMVLTSPAQGPYAPIQTPLSMEQVPGRPIYYSLGKGGVPRRENEGNTSNAGFVVTSEGVVVFDALGTPSLGWALLEEIRKRTEKPVRYVVVSHYHADHIYGLQAFKDHAGATVVAQERSAEYKENEDTADERATDRLAQRRAALSPWVDANTRVVPPDVMFSEKAIISLGGKEFVLIYAGPAHSASDAMMMVQPDGVLFAGDIVQSGRVPFMNSDDVDTRRWLNSLREVSSLKPTFIIPGHGKASTKADEAIAFTADYIAYVRSEMKKAVDEWVDFETAYAATDWSKYDNLPAFGATNKGNAYRIFLELEAANFGAIR